MNRAVGYGLVLSTFLITAGVLAPVGCDSSPAKGTGGTAGSATGGMGGGAGAPGAGGAGGLTGQGGAAGEAAAGGAAGGAAAGGAGGAATTFGAVNAAGDVFQACGSPSEYVTSVTTIAYGGPQAKYTPACLKIAAGTAVTFSPASTTDNFVFHPLEASSYGKSPSPIAIPATGTSATITFTAPGFYAYFCGVHGTDKGVGMAGVVWVE